MISSKILYDGNYFTSKQTKHKLDIEGFPPIDPYDILYTGLVFARNLSTNLTVQKYAST
jgi:hypothetical protein